LKGLILKCKEVRTDMVKHILYILAGYNDFCRINSLDRQRIHGILLVAGNTKRIGKFKFKTGFKDVDKCQEI